jgi:REP element-mobilizing transposase RayT
LAKERFFQNRYRIPTARLQNWDYGRNAAYFITICTLHRECWFGHIQNGNMILSEFGNIANWYWQDIPIHFPFVKLGEFIVMPNHIHGIIIILIVKIPAYNPKLVTVRQERSPQTASILILTVGAKKSLTFAKHVLFFINLVQINKIWDKMHLIGF